MAEPVDYRAYAAAGIAALQRWYRPRTGRWRTTGWWNAANALTAVISYTERTGDRTYADVVERTFERGLALGTPTSSWATTTTTAGGGSPGWRRST